MSDEEAAEAQTAEEIETVGEWDGDGWRAVRRKRVRLMEAAERGGAVAVRAAESARMTARRWRPRSSSKIYPKERHHPPPLSGFQCQAGRTRGGSEMTTKEEHNAAAVHLLEAMGRGGRMARRIRRLLTSLTAGGEEDGPNMGALFAFADAGNKEALLTLFDGWQRHGMPPPSISGE